MGESVGLRRSEKSKRGLRLPGAVGGGGACSLTRLPDVVGLDPTGTLERYETSTLRSKRAAGLSFFPGYPYSGGDGVQALRNGSTLVRWAASRYSGRLVQSVSTSLFWHMLVVGVLSYIFGCW